MNFHVKSFCVLAMVVLNGCVSMTNGELVEIKGKLINGLPPANYSLCASGSLSGAFTAQDVSKCSVIEPDARGNFVTHITLAIKATPLSTKLEVKNLKLEARLTNVARTTAQMNGHHVPNGPYVVKVVDYTAETNRENKQVTITIGL